MDVTVVVTREVPGKAVVQYPTQPLKAKGEDAVYIHVLEVDLEFNATDRRGAIPQERHMRWLVERESNLDVYFQDTQVSVKNTSSGNTTPSAVPP